MDLRNQVILVTGGASGLGAGTARALTAQGAGVVVAAVQEEAGQGLAAELGQTYTHCDVTAESAAQAAVDAATALGTLRGVVNCAGIAPAARIVGKNGPHELSLFRRVIEINLVGSFNMARLAATAMWANEPQATGER